MKFRLDAEVAVRPDNTLIVEQISDVFARASKDIQFIGWGRRDVLNVRLVRTKESPAPYQPVDG